MNISEKYIFQRTQKLMGNRFEISVVSENENWANERIEEAVEEIQRIEKLFTTFNESSQTSLINSLAGVKPVEVDKEVYELIKRSKKISELTQGAFDITYGSIDKSLWNFDLSMNSLPDRQIAKKMIRLINYKNVILDDSQCSVFLKEKGMRIGFGGIGKGYAADMAKKLMIKNGVFDGVVNASGDLNAWGFQADGNPWTVGIADPESKNKAFSYMNISNMAIATSGSYEKFVMIDRKKYSHTIDPQTGYPVAGIKSVSIISPYAEISDAMATPVIVMGIKAGLHMINQLDYLACIIIDDDNKLYCSNNINLK